MSSSTDGPVSSEPSHSQFADASTVAVIAPNFKRRFTGVSATIMALVPVQARSVGIAILGVAFPGVARLRLGDFLGHGWSAPAGRPFRIWHARRNSEMLAGIVLRQVLRMKLRLVFTSAAIRRHSPLPRLLIRMMDTVIATTPEAAAQVPNVVAVIPHGVDTARFTAPLDKAAAWQTSGLPGRYGIGIFGRVRPEKGTDIFVAAMCALLPANPGFTAVIAGRCAPEHQSFRDALAVKIADAGIADRVLWTGHIEPADLPSWYQRCLIAVAPARYEGYGLTVLEAMASGCAAIASPTGAFSVMIADGVTGRMLPALEEEALVAALRPLLADPGGAIAMGSAGRARAEAKFSVVREAEAINAVYGALWASAGTPSAKSLR